MKSHRTNLIGRTNVAHGRTSVPLVALRQLIDRFNAGASEFPGLIHVLFQCPEAGESWADPFKGIEQEFALPTGPVFRRERVSLWRDIPGHRLRDGFWTYQWYRRSMEQTWYGIPARKAFERIAEWASEYGSLLGHLVPDLITKPNERWLWALHAHRLPFRFFMQDLEGLPCRRQLVDSADQGKLSSSSGAHWMSAGRDTSKWPDSTNCSYLSVIPDVFLESALRITTIIDEQISGETAPLSGENTQQRAAPGRISGRGRPPLYDPVIDAKLVADWKASGLKLVKDFSEARNLKEIDVQRAIDRVEARRRSEARQAG